MIEREIFSSLSATVILFQASMESILSNVLTRDQRVAENFNDSGFKNNWINTLEAVNAYTKEFKNYNKIIYKGFRNPLVHLDPKSDDLKKINDITFEKVYSGIRYGWWAHIRLLEGIGLENSNYSANWKNICSGVGLNPNLYPESHPEDT